MTRDASTLPPPPTIDGYRLLQRVGEGGMGEVWLAEQVRPVRRQVAFKMIKAGMDTAHVVARFEAERQALAVMDHPAIAKVFDAGATPQGRPYFVMEYVRGEPITTYCKRHRLSTRDRLHLFLQVCDGVQHAHQKGIIHRDLKPSNILVTLLDGRPVTKIIDFGVAKAIAQPLIAGTMYTEIGVLIGTPEYMSPEQAEMSGLDIDTRSDVYALGVVLYELLTGLLPFDTKRLRDRGLDEIRRTIRDVEPLRPSARVTTAAREAAAGVRSDSIVLGRELRGDLDWITMRALEKDRTRRYGSAAEFADDLRRHLNNLPVVACPPSTRYRVGKFVRRHRVGVAVSAVLVTLLVAFATTTAIQAMRIAQERDRANQEAAVATAINDFLRTDVLAQASADAQADTNAAPDPDLKVRTALDRAAQRIAGKFKGQPLVEASIRQVIGRTYMDLALYPEARPHLEQALALRREARLDTDAESLTLLNSLAELQMRQGRFVEAEPLYVSLLDLRRRVQGAEDRGTLETMNDLGVLYRRMGRLADAEKLLTDALEIRRRVQGAEHPETLVAMSNLGVVYGNQRQPAKAMAIQQEVLAIRRRVLGPDHPNTLQSANNLGSNLLNLKRFSEAEPLLIEAVDGRRRTLGENHPDTLVSMSNLATLYRNQGDYARAAPLFTAVMEGRKRLHGESHPDTLLSMYSLGRLAYLQRNYPVAESQLLTAVEGQVRALGPQHPTTEQTRRALVRLYADWGKPDKAAEWRARLQREEPAAP
jgi:non-specific serine/threonine protein kinase/serine/threonine-protein kinase